MRVRGTKTQRIENGNKMEDLKLTVSTLTLNVNGINALIRSQRL